MEAGHPRQDPAQRGRARSARARADLLPGEHRDRSKSIDHGDDEEGRGQSRACVPLARKAVRRHQRQRQTRQLFARHGHRAQSAQTGQQSRRKQGVFALLPFTFDPLGVNSQSSVAIGIIGGVLFSLLFVLCIFPIVLVRHFERRKIHE